MAEPVGGLDEEAARLVEALRDWSGTHTGGDGECRYCPVCRAIASVRRTSPEVMQHLGAAAAELAAAVAAALSTPSPEDRREEP